MSKRSVFVKITAQEGKRDELVAAFEAYLPAVREEEDTLVYSISTDDADPNAVWIFELYPDDEALGVHTSSSAMAEFGKSLGGLIAGGPELHLCTTAVAKGHDA